MKRYALSVGIGKYNSNILADLHKPASDAEAVAQILEKHGDFQEVKRLPANWLNHYQCEVADSKLTGEELTKELKYFLLEQAKNSEALIYFSGHGFAIWDDLGEEYEGFLATSDCDIDRDREKLIDQQNGISLRQLNKLISKAQVSSLVVILDCCHAGSLLDDDLVKQTLTTFNASEKDYYLIAACRSQEKAYEAEQYSIFTEALLKGLGEENAGNDGKISCDRVFDLINSELQGLGQEPIRMGWGRSITLVTHTNKIWNQTEVKEECPYQGLKAFEAEQKQFFFGRKQVVNDILARLTEKPFVPVIGASGSGKSSVIRAGVIPELEDRGWRVLTPIKPGFEPLIELRRTFRKFFTGKTKEKQLKDLIENQDNTLAVIIEHLPASEQFLLIIDQFEEVFTICADREERQRFIQLLTQVVDAGDSRLAVAITLRADFLEPCLDYPSLTKLIQTQAVCMPSLTGLDLQDAIKEPAKLQGYSVQDKLFLKILGDVSKEAGFLPLLEFTLTELWQKRDREKHQLTLEQYEKLGELNGTLNSHAEKVYKYKDFEEDNPTQERTQQEKDWIQLIFLRLIRTGKDKKDTRQRQPKTKLLAIHLQVSASPIAGDEIEKQEILSELIDGENGLVKGRLLVSSEEGIDLAHEALIEAWESLIDWRQENRDLRRLLDRVEAAFWEWQKNPDDNNLMMGGLLQQVRENWQELKAYLDTAAIRFYQQSIVYESKIINAIEKANIKGILQEQANSILTFISTKYLEIEGLILGIYSTGLSLEELDGEVLSDVQYSLYQAVEKVREKTILNYEYDLNQISSLAISPDALYIAAGSGNVRLVDNENTRSVCIWDTQGNLIVEPFKPHKKSISLIALSQNAEYILTSGYSLNSSFANGEVKLWDKRGNLITEILQNVESGVTCLGFSPCDQYINVGSNNGCIWIFEMWGKSILKIPKAFNGRINSVFLNIEKNYIISIGSEHSDKRVNKKIRVWDLQGNLIDQPLEEYEYIYDDLIINTDGKYVAGSTKDREIHVWDFQRKTVFKSFHIQCDYLRLESFSPDGQYIVTTDTGNDSVHVWDLEGKEIVPPFNSTYEITQVVLSPDTTYIALVPDEVQIYLWDITLLKADDNNWQTLLKIACDRLRYHPVFQDPQTDIEKQACEICRKWVWEI